MKIATPKEIKPQEHRVGLTPASVRERVGRALDLSLAEAAHLKLQRTEAAA